MPNFRLSPTVKNDLRQVVNRLLQPMIDAAESGFPLTPDQVTRAVIPEDAQRCLSRLKAMDACLPATRMVYTIVHHPALIPRAVLLCLELPDEINFLWDVQIQPYTAKRAFNSRTTPIAEKLGKRLLFDFDTLDETSSTKFVKWVLEASRQQRICYNAHKLITQFLDYHCHSTAALLARWPGLRVLFSRMGDPWPARMRDRPKRSLRYWGWNEGTNVNLGLEWWLANEKRMEAIDGLLAAASLMSETTVSSRHERIPGVVKAFVIEWDKDKK